MEMFYIRRYWCFLCIYLVFTIQQCMVSAFCLVRPTTRFHHYENPRNVGSLDKSKKTVGTGLVGVPACGDADDKTTEPKTYSTFRKRFHVPSTWACVPDLVEHRYQVKNHEKTFLFIEKRLRNLGYSEDNQRMTHDYLHYLLADLLIEENIPFITEHDLADMPDVRSLLNNKTPDLIIKSNGITRQKPLIVDVFVGKSDKEMNEKKKKYSSMSVCFDFSGLTIGNYNSELRKILAEKNIDYFHKQVTIFRAEYAYWMSCLKLKKILFNERDNVPIVTLSKSSPEFICAVNSFKGALKRKAAELANNDSL